MNPASYHQLLSFEEALHYLQDSGHSIEHLVFRGQMYNRTEVAEISRHIARYCSDTLTQLTLSEAGDTLITEPSHRFPEVVHLELDYAKLPDALAIHRNFPATQHLWVEARLDWDDETEAHPNLRRIVDALPLLARLRSLRIFGTANEMLSAIQANAPHLESLAILFDPLKAVNGTVRFAGVREFNLTVSGLLDEHLEELPLTFDHLESFTLSADEEDFQVITKWIPQNVQLTKVALKFSSSYHLEHYARALNALPTLEDITLESRYASDLNDFLPHLAYADTVTFVAFGADAQPLEGIDHAWEVADGWTATDDDVVYTIRRRPNVTVPWPAAVHEDL